MGIGFTTIKSYGACYSVERVFDSGLTKPTFMHECLFGISLSHTHRLALTQRKLVQKTDRVRELSRLCFLPLLFSISKKKVNREKGLPVFWHNVRAKRKTAN